jgi:hypothetical protein
VEDTKQYKGEIDDQINKVQRIVVVEKRKAFEIHIEVDPVCAAAGAASQGVTLPVSMSAPVAVSATAGSGTYS